MRFKTTYYKKNKCRIKVLLTATQFRKQKTYYIESNLHNVYLVFRYPYVNVTVIF